MIDQPRLIVLASGNLGKLQEIREIFSTWEGEWKTLRDYPSCPEALEEASDYLSNAREKARLAAEHSGEWALADDSGLEVEALGWKPGPRSARYAGPKASDVENVSKLLRELSAFPQAARSAVFRCCVVLRHPDGREAVGQGELWGRIAASPRGRGGFGYDPVFIPEDFDRALAELSPEEKNLLSHRRRALEKLPLKAFPESAWRDR